MKMSFGVVAAGEHASTAGCGCSCRRARRRTSTISKRRAPPRGEHVLDEAGARHAVADHDQRVPSCVPRSVARGGSAPRCSMRAAQTLNSGMRLDRDRAPGGQAVGRLRAAPVEGHEERVRPDVARELHAEAAPRRAASRARTRVAVGEPVLRAPAAGWISRQRAPGPGSRSSRHAPRLRARLVVREHAPGGEVERIVRVGLLRRSAGGAPRGSARVRSASGSARRTGAACPGGPRTGRARRRRPRVDALVADARVVGGAARARAAQLLEDLARARSNAKPLAAPSARASSHRISMSVRTPWRRSNAGAGASRGPRGWSSCRPPRPTARRAARRRASARGLGEEEVATPPAGRARAAARRRAAVGRRDRGVRAEHEERAHAAVGAERVEHLVGRAAGAGNALGVDAPDAATCARAAGSSMRR